MRVLLLLTMAIPLLAQNPPAPNPAKPKGPPPEPKNLQVLKVTRAELIPLMRSYNQALGVQCTFCHVQGDFASDENPHKKTARMMITMTAKANAEFGDGKNRVACWTCHRGEHEPAETPALPPPPPPKPPAQ